MSKRKWHIEHRRSLVARHGTESARGHLPFITLPTDKPKRRRISKEELRRQADAALATYAGTSTRCPTGARAK